jgi:uncharacterized protein
VFSRGLAPSLATALSDSPVVFLQGARQVGKSTLVQTLPGRRYLTLDDATLLSAATSNPQGFVDGLSGPVTIDERRSWRWRSRRAWIATGRRADFC